MKKLLNILLFSAILLACDKDDADLNQGTNSGSPSDDSWDIPVNEVFDGGPGKDGIPALENPMKTIDGQFLSDDELVVGFYDGTEAVAYPHQILDWHEIINDELNGFAYAITYCPLTGTGIGWDRTIDGTTTTFGVSGLLYNNNLIPYDRKTDSNWSQMRNDCVNGELQGQVATTFMVLETSWKTWEDMFPETAVISTNTGISRSYGVYPYGDYKTNNDKLIFPLNPDDNRLDRKERVHGVLINGKAKVYQFSSFDSSNLLILDTFENRDIVIVGNTTDNFIISFYSELPDGSTPEFTAINERRNILQDTEGNKWDVFGYATEGPRMGQRLISTKSYMGYWFSWGTFYPEPDIY
jgi:hypothetical protein